MKVLVTGAHGFIGSHLVAALANSGHEVLPVVREARDPAEIAVGRIDGDTDWQPALERQPEAVVHLAARVHVMGTQGPAALASYREVNLDGTLALARQCAQVGCKRFVFVSTIKVLGEDRQEPFSQQDAPDPQDPYAQSKLDAELALQKLAAETGMELVILRPPLVYGPGVGANFLRLLRVVEQGWPLPLAAVDNRRSLVSVANLVDAIRHCLDHPAAPGTWLVSDGESVSTARLLRELAVAMECKVRLWPLPARWLMWVGRLLGQGESVARVTGSLSVDDAAFRSALGWQPPQTRAQALSETVDWYRSTPGGHDT